MQYEVAKYCQWVNADLLLRHSRDLLVGPVKNWTNRNEYKVFGLASANMGAASEPWTDALWLKSFAIRTTCGMGIFSQSMQIHEVVETFHSDGCDPRCFALLCAVTANRHKTLNT
jgi:hypothetical protein